MKKIFGLFAVATLAFVACNKGPIPGSTILPIPVNQENHMSFTITSSDQDGKQDANGHSYTAPSLNNPGGKKDDAKRFDFSSGRTGFVIFEEYGPAPFNYTTEESSKAVAVGTTYILEGIGRLTIIKIEGSKMTLEFVPENSTTKFTFIGTLVDEPKLSPIAKDACRVWTISETIVSITGDGISSELGVAKSFEGCSINAISKYAIGKGVKIKEQPKDYDVEKIVLQESGKFAIVFKKAKPYYGDYLLPNENSFSYNFEFHDDDDPIIAGQAEGSFKVTAIGKGRLAVTGNMTDQQNKHYAANVIFVLDPEKE